MPVGTPDALDAVIAAPYHRRMRERLQPLVTAELIASYDADPTGPPSDDLRRVLTYLAAAPIDNGLILERDPEGQWFVCRLIGSRPRYVDRVAGPLATRRDALVEVFRRRLTEVLGVEPGSWYA